MSHSAPERAVFIDAAHETRSPEQIDSELRSLHETLSSLLTGVAANKATIAALDKELAELAKQIVDSAYLEPSAAADQHDRRVRLARAERSRFAAVHANLALEPELADLRSRIASSEAALNRKEH